MLLSHPFSRSPFALNLGHIATAMLPRFMSKSDSRKRALDLTVVMKHPLNYSSLYDLLFCLGIIIIAQFERDWQREIYADGFPVGQLSRDEFYIYRLDCAQGLGIKSRVDAA